jgi:quercetin dioxygenase-like cupin family protein
VLQPIRFRDAPDTTPFPGVVIKLLMNKEKGSAAISILLTPAGIKHSITNVGTDEVRILFFFPAIEVERILVE